ncbi:hypothetical protein Tco_1283524 [Tanacetum coccineum]
MTYHCNCHRSCYHVFPPKVNIVASFARTSREDSQKLLAPEYYPSWVALIVLVQSFFFLQLTWLNSHLIKIWPHVNETLLSELSNEVGFTMTNTSFDALLESLLSTDKPFPQSAGYQILAS